MLSGTQLLTTRTACQTPPVVAHSQKWATGDVQQAEDECIEKSHWLPPNKDGNADVLTDAQKARVTPKPSRVPAGQAEKATQTVFEQAEALSRLWTS
jgi:hypothetical protein